MVPVEIPDLGCVWVPCMVYDSKGVRGSVPYPFSLPPPSTPALFPTFCLSLGNEHFCPFREDLPDSSPVSRC